MMLTAWLKQRSTLQSAAAGLYQAAAIQSRHPVFYRELAVPDSLDGRFDMLCLHVFLIMQRLDDFGRDGRRLSQRLFDHMFKVVNLSLRELGIGDMGVPKHMKKMMKAFNGRSQAYMQALKTDDSEGFASAISRNVFRAGDEQGIHPAAAPMANYVFNVRDQLAYYTLDDFLSGGIAFVSLDGVPEEGEITHA